MFRRVCLSYLVGRHNGQKSSTRQTTYANLGGEEVQVIRYPIGRQQILLKAKEKRRGKVITVPRPGKLLISTNDRKLNMYTNEFPTKFEPPALASETWTSARSPGRYFIIHPTRENPSVNYENTEEHSFESLGLSSTITKFLSNIGIQSPTNIQRKVIPILLKGENVMLAAETGSGKTFSYFLPIAHHLIQSKSEGDEKKEYGPSAIVLTPSKELSSQFLVMCSEFGFPLNIASLDDIWANKKRKHVLTADVIVATPVLILAALQRRLLTLNTVRFAVIDECDTLLDSSFCDYLCSILARLNIYKGKSRPLSDGNEVQLILSSATFPKYAGKALEDIIALSDLSSVTTGYMHRISPHVLHKFIRVRPSEKFSSLIHILQEECSNGTTMIFCNRKNTVQWVSKELILHGFSVDKLHSGLKLKERKEIAREAQLGKTTIFVCTDLSSRGLDTQNIQHIINYEMPDAASDYIHRSGRVGRVGQSVTGRVTSLICKKWEVPLVMKIEEAARRRDRIEGVSADIKSYHNRRWDEKFGGLEIELVEEDTDT